MLSPAFRNIIENYIYGVAFNSLVQALYSTRTHFNFYADVFRLLFVPISFAQLKRCAERCTTSIFGQFEWIMLRHLDIILSLMRFYCRARQMMSLLGHMSAAPFYFIEIDETFNEIRFTSKRCSKAGRFCLKWNYRRCAIPIPMRTFISFYSNRNACWHMEYGCSWWCW